MAVTYQCHTCKKTVTVPKKGKAPKCCGKPMKQVPDGDVPSAEPS